MTQVADNLSAMHARIQRACEACNRQEGDVQLLLATKTQTPSHIIEALKCGEMVIGENRVQELVEKAPELKTWRVEKHLIGHLQSNKAGKALDHVTCVQSIDRLSIAEKLNRLCEQRSRTLDIFLQFNTTGEESKFGMNPSEAIKFTRDVDKLPNLRICGLMTVGLLAPHVVMSRESLRDLRLLRDHIQAEAIGGVNLRHLSMGMSTDLEIAIQEGSTMVRIGTDVFGKRDLPPGSYWPEKEWQHLAGRHKE